MGMLFQLPCILLAIQDIDMISKILPKHERRMTGFGIGKMAYGE
jgi:hypothetical protein